MSNRREFLVRASAAAAVQALGITRVPAASAAAVLLS